MNIVYVEDNRDDARLVKMYAKSAGHHIVIIDETNEVENALNSDPDLILLDIVLWYSRLGHEIVRDLREKGYAKPIIAVTGLATHRDQQECREAGFTDILTKPFTINQLAAILDR